MNMIKKMMLYIYIYMNVCMQQGCNDVFRILGQPRLFQNSKIRCKNILYFFFDKYTAVKMNFKTCSICRLHCRQAGKKNYCRPHLPRYTRQLFTFWQELRFNGEGEKNGRRRRHNWLYWSDKAARSSHPLGLANVDPQFVKFKTR